MATLDFLVSFFVVLVLSLLLFFVTLCVIGAGGLSSSIICRDVDVFLDDEGRGGQEGHKGFCWSWF